VYIGPQDMPHHPNRSESRVSETALDGRQERGEEDGEAGVCERGAVELNASTPMTIEDGTVLSG